MNKILLPAIVSSYRPKADKSFSIGLSTQILNEEEILILNKMHQQMCYVFIKDAEIDSEEYEMVDNVDVDPLIGIKSKSQQVKILLWRNWKEKNLGFDNAKDHYNHYMDKLIEKLKSSLE